MSGTKTPVALRLPGLPASPQRTNRSPEKAFAPHPGVQQRRGQ
ncbi:hypothetical protein [Phytobacter ursingii]|uniref:Uncharacterized protein n=1 Tax=Phytobacter ursingii TaxID=1972431 RepID=A0AB35RID3_9ENTR|nr:MULTISPECIES: hypothetical protein [Enterobacteriaceae]MDV2861665.1 hypothetical protein [Phytobacter ursingii]